MSERAAGGLRLGGGLAVGVLAAALVPVLVVGALAWPGLVAPASSPPSPAALSPAASAARPAIDFDGLLALVRSAAPAPAPAASSTAASSTMAASTGLVYQQGPVDAARALMRRIAKARDVRRAAGASYAELKKPFSLEELGGVAAEKDLGVAAGKRLLMGRDGKVLGPPGTALPVLAAGSLASSERDEDVLEADATLDGKPVRVLRRCVAGELTCLVDIAPAPPAATGLASAGAAASAGPGAPGLVEALERERAKLAAWQPPAPASSTPAPAGLLDVRTAAAAGAALALVLGVLLALRLRALSSLVTSTTGRLRAVAAGAAPPATPAPGIAELDALARAVDEAAAALGDGALRSEREQARTARLEAVAAGLDAARARVDQRVPAAGDDELAVTAVVTAANAFLEAFEAKVVRWKSHVEVVEAPPAVSDVEKRAQALAPLPGVMLEVAQRLLRLARVQGMPQKLVDELAALGNALAERGKTAQTLVDQLLLDAATDRKGARPQGALDALRAELAALAPAPTTPTAVAALADLPAGEIARRLDALDARDDGDGGAR